MSTTVLHKYFDANGRAFANIAFTSQDRVLLSVVAGGMAIFRLHLWGRIPGRRIFATDAVTAERMHRVLVRGSSRLPVLPRACDMHRDEAAMSAFLDAAIVDLKAVGEGRAVPGAVDALDLEQLPERPLSVFTRLALTAVDRDDCARLFERVRNTA